MKIILLIWTLSWKTAVITVSIAVGSLGASGIGWHGAELIAEFSWRRLLVKAFVELLGLSFDQDVVVNSSAAIRVGVYLCLSTVMCFGPSFLVYKIAKPMLFIMVPIFLWVAMVGARNGIVNGFDVSRAFSQ